MITNDNDQNHDFIRKCIICGSDLHLCMGFVLARDFIADKRPPRELCGKCVLITDPKDIPD